MVESAGGNDAAAVGDGRAGVEQGAETAATNLPLVETAGAGLGFIGTPERVQLALRAAEIGLWEWDVSAGTIRWSEEHERLAGLEPGEFGGTVEAFAALVHPDDRARMLAEAERGIENGRFGGVYRVILADASVRWLEGKGTVFKNEDGLVALGVTYDVTASHELKDQLRQSQKMQAIGQLAGGIAHDFNNALQVIDGYAQLLEPTVSATSDADKLAQLRTATAHATSLTKQLLAFSRKQELQPRTIDLHEHLVDGAIRLQRLLGARIIVATVLKAESAKVDADPTQIEQILLNLGTNARDAMPGGGTLQITTSNVTLDKKWIRGHDLGSGPGRYICACFVDNGPGIDPQIRDRLFEPFATTKPPGQGTGLGLASVYGIVKQSGGYITAGGDPGAGATFAIYLPLVAP